MPTFTTLEPISVSLELVAGDAQIVASDRGDTVVDVRPSDASADADVRAAQSTRVEYADGRLLVKTPKQRGLGLFARSGSVDVSIALPTGSRVQGDAAAAAFRGTGRLGACRIKTATGDIQLDHTGISDLNTAAGAVVVNHVAGHAEVRTGSGTVRLQAVDGTAVIKNSNGDSWVGTVTGDLRVNAANGDIVVDRSQAGLTATTANGDVRVGEVQHGWVSVKTACGELQIGVRSGTAALLDLYTQYGTVHNRLEACDGPAQDDGRVEVRARTSYGDIVIHRS
jgi:DUF4097 and DUF4098 domain-containing protein YvlB